MNNEALIASLAKDLSFELAPVLSMEEIQAALEEHINQLLTTNFEKLVSLLYRIDIDETRLRELLRYNPEVDSGKIIAGLILERQLQKINNRRQNTRPGNTATHSDEEEKW